jgi:hypothetical protein
MKARPVQRPDWRAAGARPARLAACAASRVPSPGISIRSAKAVIREAGRAHYSSGFRPEGKKKSVGGARDARQDGEAFGELRIGFDDGENGRADGGNLTLNLVEALRILPFQQRERPDFGAALRACPEKVARLFRYLDIGYIRCLMRTCSKSLNLSGSFSIT